MDFLVTEFLDGISLTDEGFEAMGKRDQGIILQRLGEQLQLLRSVEPEGAAYYGRVNHQGWNRVTSFMKHFNPGSRGPFDTYEDFISALLESSKYRFAAETWCPEFLPHQIECLAELKRVLGASKNYKPVLTHFDMKFENIVAWPINKSANGECEDWKVTIIDWDHAGWAPLYMQKAALFQRLMWPKELGEEETFCGFRKDEYREEVDVLMRCEDELALL
jgi:thiamine kinase-like enzyme